MKVKAMQEACLQRSSPQLAPLCLNLLTKSSRMMLPMLSSPDVPALNTSWLTTGSLVPQAPCRCGMGAAQRSWGGQLCSILQLCNVHEANLQHLGCTFAVFSAAGCSFVAFMISRCDFAIVWVQLSSIFSSRMQLCSVWGAALQCLQYQDAVL